MSTILATPVTTPTNKYSITKGMLITAPLPEQTSTYKPITHRQLIDQTLEGLDKAGFVVKREIYKSARDGQQAVAQYHIEYGNDPEMGMMVGWHNSYDKSMSLKFAIGAHIFICSNGCVRGDIGAFRKKHAGDIQTYAPAQIGEYLKQAEETYSLLLEDKKRMREREVTKRMTAELLGRMFIEESIITSTQLSIIKKEIEAPSFDYKAEGSMWELYNHTTYALKEGHPSSWFQRHIDVHNFFMETV